MADGIIIAHSEIPDAVRQMDVPIIGIDVGEPVGGMPNIVGDNNAIAEMALSHFTDRGFSQLVYCQFEGIPWATARGEGFAAYAKEKGLDVFQYDIKSTDDKFSWDDEIPAIGEWLKSLPYPLGLFGCNDDCSKLLTAACVSEGIRVPDDVAILGVDNDEMICLPSDSTLSSIALDFEKAGFQAAALLDQIMKEQVKLESQEIVHGPKNVDIRQSTDTLAVNDSNVASALRFIRENINKVSKNCG